jgi:IS605 OrfB family transposase
LPAEGFRPVFERVRPHLQAVGPHRQRPVPTVIAWARAPFSEVEAKRERYAQRHTDLQKVGTRAAKKRLRQMGGRQSRYQKHVNHCISKAIVAKAKRLHSAVALEDLKPIRPRVKADQKQRKRWHHGGFGHWRAGIEYKAKRQGVPVVAVDPAYTSQACAVCGAVDKRHRPTQGQFRCVACGHEAHADHNAARPMAGRAAVTRPMFAHLRVPGAVGSRLL